ncbi:MAG: porin family protein [Ferruginibacter sp.]|nr:porin family protein [Ferruginibacter sp.]
MQDEEMNNMDELIREASNSHHPVYDDKAWQMMEALLDKHLPQKHGRKRPVVFYWLLVSLLTGGAIFAVLYPWNKKEITRIANNESKLKKPSSQNATALTLARKEYAAPGEPAGRLWQEGILNTKDEAFNRSKIANTTKLHPAINDRITSRVSGDAKNNSGQKESATNSPVITTDSDGQVATPAPQPVAVSPGDRIKDKAPVAVLPALADSIGKRDLTQVTTPPLPKENPSPNKVKTKENTKKGFANNFAVTLSGGPDLSFIKLDDPGKTRLTYGAGLRYTFKKRFTVSSGLYVSKKVYSAKPADYHPPKGYWTYFTDLQRVDADCKVYEIPLSVNYQFKQKGNHSWFAGIGFSSFIMKSETYDYLYKDAMGRTMYKGWTLNNQNKHYFSVLNISGGYQYRVNRNFSIIAEPYIKLPLHGIGFGKIKLNSGGILLTASIQPFAKRK